MPAGVAGVSGAAPAAKFLPSWMGELKPLWKVVGSPASESKSDGKLTVRLGWSMTGRRFSRSHSCEAEWRAYGGEDGLRRRHGGGEL